MRKERKGGGEGVMMRKEREEREKGRVIRKEREEREREREGRKRRGGLIVSDRKKIIQSFTHLKHENL